MTPADVRSLFPITRNRAYLFSGGLTPAATPVRNAHDRWTELWASDPAALYAQYDAEWELARQRFATLIGAEADEIAVVDNTSRASNLIVQMIAPPPGSNVVVDEFTYPSSRYPWLLPSKSDVEVRLVPARNHRISLDDLARVIDERTIAVSISHVSPLTGFRHDVAAVADLIHQHGGYLIVDAAQSAGALSIDVRQMGIDFLATCAMKWLLGAPGVGFLFVASPLAERLGQPQVGYASLDPSPSDEPSGLPPFKPGARRHELGLPSLPGLAATRAGLDLLLDIGMEEIERQVLELSGAGIAGLLRRDLTLFTHPEVEARAGVIGLPVNAGRRVVAFLRDRAVDVWTDSSETLLRIDPHVFNNRDDIDRLLAGLDEFVQTHGRGALQG